MISHETTISLESYAAVLAGLGAGLPLSRALDLADVPALEWDGAAEHWQAQIDESAASDLALLVAFDAALLAAKRRFEPAIEPIESDPCAWAHFRRHFVTAVDPAAFLAQHGMTLPSYARLEADWANRSLSDKTLAETIQKHLEAPLQQCPTITLVPSPWLVQNPGEPVVQRVARPDEALSAEDSVTAIRPIQIPALPMTEPTVVPAPFFQSSSSSSASMDSPPSTQPTQYHSQARDALPFQKLSALSAPAEREPAVAAPECAAATARSNLESTQETLPDAVRGDALPFGRSAPAAPPAAPELPALTLEQYASLCVELSMTPARAQEITLRYGLSDEQRARVDAYWRHRVESDPDVRTAWNRAYVSYREWLMGRQT